MTHRNVGCSTGPPTYPKQWTLSQSTEHVVHCFGYFRSPGSTGPRRCETRFLLKGGPLDPVVYFKLPRLDPQSNAAV